ncbi:alpha/beta hydrolase [Nocardia macrotermitis]|uniref:Carboxylesterase NlhH n=1 Tax=Nocardia macrotermitis TaxID=2585198 RepID=A0A7K0D7F8_9NOCA|nr:alpha/beta hydrolase [Nocardia macrotermitis]MQY21579.1 Carboxylesterase NlhH [Nocardia macrotermitis]
MTENPTASYAFDPELAPWIPSLPVVDITDVVAARESIRAIIASMPKPPTPETVTITDVAVPGPEGAREVPVRVYAPTDRNGLRPALLFMHGGGFVMGSLDSEHTGCVRLADELGAVVVSVDYRLAPEHPFPAGLLDCYTALEWLAAQADTLSVDAARIGVCGASAGGGLAAGVALLARDRQGPPLRIQVLQFPELDDRMNSVSMRTFSDTPLWNRPNAELSWKYYLSAPTPELDITYAAPARVEDLSGLPPTFLSACEFDPLRDEDLHYAHHLLECGVTVESHHYPGTFHGSSIVAEAAVTKRMYADYLGALRRGLGITTETTTA